MNGTQQNGNHSTTNNNINGHDSNSNGNSNSNNQSINDDKNNNNDGDVNFRGSSPPNGSSLLTQPSNVITSQNNITTQPTWLNNNSTTSNGQKPKDFEMAVMFICTIKDRFGPHRNIYTQFLNILQRM